MKKNWVEIPLHLLFWALCFWMMNETFAFESQEVQNINGIERTFYTRSYEMSSFFVISLMMKALLMYVNAFWLLPTFFKNKNLKDYFLKACLLISLTMLLEFSLNLLNWTILGDNSLRFFYSLWYLNSIFYFSFFGLSVAYRLGKNWQKNEKMRQQLVQEKLDADLNFLKSQINPHFLFNTLNNLFAIAERHKNQQLSDGIAGLSNLMRYMLYDCKADFVPLEKELQFLENLIAIQQLRITEKDEVTIAFNLEGAIENKKIAPLILIPFVENAFKHGINFNKNSFIKIDVKTNDNQLIFNVLNSVSKNENEFEKEYSGIGLENVKRRLALIYPNRHSLKIEEKEAVFSVQLKIEMHQII